MHQSKHYRKVRENDSQSIQVSHSLTYQSNKWHHSSTATKSTRLNEPFKTVSPKHSKNILNIHLTIGECYLPLHCAKLMCLSRPQLSQTNHWHLVEEIWPDAQARQALLMSQAGPSLFISDRSTYLLWQLQVPSWARERRGSPNSTWWL